VSVPRVSVLILDTHGKPAAAIGETVASLVSQTEPAWEAVVVGAFEALKGRKGPPTSLINAADRLVMRKSSATSLGELAARGLAAATGEWVCVLEPGDALAPEALALLLAAARRMPSAQLAYADERGADGAEHTKPGWSPTYLHGCPYVGRPALLRRRELLARGGFRADAGTAVEWAAWLDLAASRPGLARSNRSPWDGGAAVHVAQLLAIRSGTVGVAARGLGEEADRRRMLTAYLARNEAYASVESAGPAGCFRVRRPLPNPPLVSVVVPTRGGHQLVREMPTELVSNALRSLVARTDYPAYELVVVLTDGYPADLPERLRRLAADRPLRLVRDPGGFDFSRACHTGVDASRGALVCLLNDDIEVTHPDWLSRMVEHAMAPGVGVVGAQLRYEDGRIQHAGVIQQTGLLSHRFAGAPDGFGPEGLLSLDVDYIAVTGACLLTPRAVWNEVGGLSGRLPVNYGDVDYCLRVRATGRRVLVASGAVLIHFESSSREQIRATAEELDTWSALWASRLAVDPYLGAGPMSVRA